MNTNSTRFLTTGQRALLLGGALALAFVGLLIPSAIFAGTPAAPASMATPQILGTAIVGNTITVGNGSWSNSSPLRFSYRWLRCPATGGASDGSDCSRIFHAPRSYYRVRAADLSSSIRARVTATSKSGTAHVISDATDIVVAANKKPVSLSPPAISGKPVEGEALTAMPGPTTGARPIDYSYLWRRCNEYGGTCSTITGANDRTYSPTKADTGHTLRVRVIASNRVGKSWATSTPTALLATAARSTAPRNTGEPSTLGTPVVGNKLTATKGSWSGSTPMSFSYQWRRCPKDGGASDASNCAVISNAAGNVYTVRSADVGLRLRVRVTAKNSDGSDTAASNATDTVRAHPAPAATKPAMTSPPTISGNTQVGQTLTANVGNWSGTQQISFAYQWRRCDKNGGSCSDISGATDRSYTLKQVDSGNTLRVQVTASNSAGKTSATSSPTALVHEAPAPGPGGVINLPDGLRSIPVANVPKGERLLIADVRFEPNVVTSRSRPITVRVRVKDTRGYVIRGALLFGRATPRVTTSQTLTSATDGWVTLQLRPLATFPLKQGAVQFFLRAYRAGDPLLTGISTRRLVQVIVRQEFSG